MTRDSRSALALALVAVATGTALAVALARPPVPVSSSRPSAGPAAPARIARRSLAPPLPRKGPASRAAPATVEAAPREPVTPAPRAALAPIAPGDRRLLVRGRVMRWVSPDESVPIAGAAVAIWSTTTDPSRPVLDRTSLQRLRATLSFEERLAYSGAPEENVQLRVGTATTVEDGTFALEVPLVVVAGNPAYVRVSASARVGASTLHGFAAEMLGDSFSRELVLPVIELDPTLRAVFTVRADGAPLPGASVEVDEDVLLTTDARGVASVDLWEGSIGVLASAPGRASLEQTIEPTGDEVQAAIDLAPETPITLHVVDPEGAPARGTVTARSKNRSGVLDQGSLDARGTVVLRRVPTGVPVELQVVAGAPWAPLALGVTAPCERAVTLERAALLLVDLKVEGDEAAGRSTEDFAGTLVRQDEVTREWVEVAKAPKGQKPFVFEGLAAGTYRVRASFEGRTGGFPWALACSPPIQLAGGETRRAEVELGYGIAVEGFLVQEDGKTLDSARATVVETGLYVGVGSLGWLRVRLRPGAGITLKLEADGLEARTLELSADRPWLGKIVLRRK